MSVRYLVITSEEDGQRLDNYLMRILKGVPKSHIYRIIRAGEVRVNKKRAKPDLRLHTDDHIRIPPVRVAEVNSVHVGPRLAQQLQSCIIYEDAALIVVNKPVGLAVHGGSGVSLGLIEALRKSRSDLSYLELVHRLDKETSGCLLLAKKRSMLRSIQALLASRDITKRYWAILTNPWEGKKTITVKASLEKNILKSGERMVRVTASGRDSQTKLNLLENFANACWIEAMPKTGRTHQIRVHCAHVGHPIMGDNKYGDKTNASSINAENNRLYLHARAIQFNLEGKQYQFEAEIDERFVKMLEQLRQSAL